MPNQFTSVEVIFLGTGASDEVPNASCLLFSEESPCPACASAQMPGSPDRRRQSSAVLKLHQSDGHFKTILIDAGWTLSAAILDLFPKHGISKLDAVFITHEHADAVNGLPYLRGWTLHHFQPSIEVYTSSRTFAYIEKYFPYLVKWSDGGPASTRFNYHLTPDTGAFTCLEGALEVYALAVHHGGKSFQEPFFSTGYSFFGSRLVYMSDVNHIPDSTHEAIDQQRRASSDPSATSTTDVFIVDCLKVKPSRAHFGLGQSLAASKRLGAQKTYFTQISDGLNHAQLSACCQAIASCPDETAAAASPELKAFQDIRTTHKMLSDGCKSKTRILHREDGVRDDDEEAIRGFALQQALKHGGLGVQHAQPAYDGLVVTLQLVVEGSRAETYG